MTNQQIHEHIESVINAEDLNDYELVKMTRKLLEVNEIYREALDFYGTRLASTGVTARDALAKAEEVMR